MRTTIKNGYIKFIFLPEEQIQIKKKTLLGKYYEELENFYYCVCFTDLIHKDVEIDFATRVEVGRNISLKGKYLEEVISEIYDILEYRKKHKLFANKIKVYDKKRKK